MRQFFASVAEQNTPLYLSAITIGELRRGFDLIQHRGDNRQAKLLPDWLNKLIEQYQNHILGIDSDIAMLWGKLRVPHPENTLDKLIAATAVIYDLTVVTRNVKYFERSGVHLLNPFEH